MRCFCLPNYIKKAWTRLELKAAQNRAFLNSEEYILPLMLEPGIKLPGLPDTIGYIGAYDHTKAQIVKIICKKVTDSKPSKKEEFETNKKMYSVIFDTLDFIVTRYSCFCRDSKLLEFELIKFTISQYKDFLLEYVYEINDDLYTFIVEILKDLTAYVAENAVNFYHSVDMRYRANILKLLRTAFEESGYNPKFDFRYYLYNNDIEGRQSELIPIALKDLLDDLNDRIETQITAMDYLKVISRLMYFDVYVIGYDTPTIIEYILKNTELLQELESLLESSETVQFQDDEITEDLKE